MHQQQTAFKNIVVKEETARKEQFLPFPQCFLLNQKIVSDLSIFLTACLFAAELEEPEIGISGKGLINIHCNKNITCQKSFVFSSMVLTLYHKIRIFKNTWKEAF